MYPAPVSGFIVVILVAFARDTSVILLETVPALIPSPLLTAKQVNTTVDDSEIVTL